MFQLQALFVIFLAISSAAWGRVLPDLPQELSEFTGLSEAQLKRLILPEHALHPRATNCSTNDTSGGVFPGPGNPSASDLIKRNSFVKRVGTKLQLAGKDFRMVGANIYWLGLDENVIPDPSYPSKTRVLEALADVSVMKGTTVRSHTLGISVGNPLSIETALDVFNDTAFESIDFAITAARVYGLKLLIPLVDNYNYFNGGKYQFIGWHGIPFSGTGANITPPDVGAFFFNTTAIVDSFKRYVSHLLSHVNQYTGIALKDDPTILGWESGNELSAVRFGDGPAPAVWTKEIGQLVKNLAPNHLFMDGTYGIYPDTDQLSTKEVDLFGDHFYPPNITRLKEGYELVTKVERNYLAGEYDWTGQNGGDDLTTFLSTIYGTGSIGDMFWSLFGHDDECCQYVEHDDGFSFYYLREDPSDLYVDREPILIDHAAQMSGEQVPQKFPAVACPQYRYPHENLPPVFRL